MSGKWSTPKRCGCRDENGRELGKACPKRKSRHHGTYGYATRIPAAGGVKLLRRFGFGTAGKADEAARHAWDLIGLAGADKRIQARIGDLILDATRDGGQLPAVEDVRRRLGLRRDPGDTGETFGGAWETWLAGKRKAKRASTVRSLAQIGKNWLLPVLAEVPLERLTGTHCEAVFERVDRFNAALAAAAAEDRTPVLEGDVRAPRTGRGGRYQRVGVATQHRIFAALRGFLNFQWKVAHALTFNPVYAVQLAPEEEYEAQRWTAAQTRAFLRACADDELGLMFRVVVLCGARRAEAAGFRWESSDLGAGYLAVERPIVQLGGQMDESAPKSKKSRRKIWLDDTTLKLLREWRKTWLAMRMRAEAWQDSDVVFCKPDGSPWRPDTITRRWKKLAKEAGLPVIRLHDGRHTASSIADDAGVSEDIRQRNLGHSSKKMTRHYTHPEAETMRGAANQAAAFVEGAEAREQRDV